MIERLEGHFWGYQDVEIFYQIWKPQSVRGTIVVTHGIGEHSEAYNKTAHDFAKDGWLVFGWDLRGHGRSEGKRGYVRRFQDFCEDLEATIRFVKAEHNPRETPLVLFGHSMGGLITAKTLINHAPQGIAGLVLSSPAVGLTLAVPTVKKRAAEFLVDWLPKITLHNEIDYNDLTRDAARVKEYRVDPYRHDKASPGLFLGMLEAFDEVLKGAEEIRVPTIMILAGKEKIVSTPQSQVLFENLGAKKKEILIYADSYHEVFNDLDREDAIRDVKAFLEKL